MSLSSEDENDCSPILSLIEENDYFLDKLRIGDDSPITIATDDDGQVEMKLPRNASDLCRLGNALGRNTNIKVITLDCSTGLHAMEEEDPRAFFDGIKKNKSIRDLRILGFNRQGRLLSDGRGSELLNSLAENATYFTTFRMLHCDLGGTALSLVDSFLRKCSNLKEIHIGACQLDHVKMNEIIAPIRKNTHLEQLDLRANYIGNTGCKTIATLLQDPSSKLSLLSLRSNGIDDEGAVTIADALKNNVTLEGIDIGANGITHVGLSAISRLLCDTSSVNATYQSNHTLYDLGEREDLPESEFHKFAPYLDLNKGTDKAVVRMKKILQNHPNIDMSSFFEWDLKVLPIAVNWLNKAASITEKKDAKDISSKKLSAIFQFVQAMPAYLEKPAAASSVPVELIPRKHTRHPTSRYTKMAVAVGNCVSLLVALIVVFIPTGILPVGPSQGTPGQYCMM